MTLAEIENLSFADLKAKQAELVQSLGGGDLAARYVQARTDAKMRDEKLGEQAKTIDALQTGIGATKEQLARETARAEQLQALVLKREADVRGLEQQLSESKDYAIGCVKQLNETVQSEASRANTAEALAKSRRKALADVTAICNPLLAAE